MKRILSLVASCFFVLLASFSFALNNSGSSNYDEDFLITGDLTAAIFSLALFIYLIGYFIVSWLKVGRDPVHPDITYYEQPKDISPAFAYYLYNKTIDAKLITCILLDLTMKGCIEIRTTQGFAFSQVSLLCKRSFGPDLSTDEKIFCDYLPYAYAMNLENAWMKKFKKSVAIDACVACARGGGAALWALVRSFCPAMPPGKKDERG